MDIRQNTVPLCLEEMDLQTIFKTDGSSGGNQLMTIPRVSRWLAEYVPVLADAKVIRAWSGWTDVTPDSCAVISKVDEIPGLITGCGFSGHGFGQHRRLD